MAGGVNAGAGFGAGSRAGSTLGTSRQTFLARKVTESVMTVMSECWGTDPSVPATLLHSFVLGLSTQLLEGVPSAALHASADLLLEDTLTS